MTISYSRLVFSEPSPAVRRLLWHVHSAGVVTRDEPEHHQGFDKPGWFLFRVVSGKGSLQLAKATVSLSVGARYWLLDLREPRAYLPAEGQSLTTTGIRFSGIGMDTWREMLGEGPEFRIRQPRDWALAVKSHGDIEKLIDRRPAGFEWRIHQLLGEILGVLLRERGTLSSGRAAVTEPVARVIKAVLADPVRDWRARDLSRLAGISYSALRAQFRATQHESIHEFLQRTRLDQARLLLCDSRLSVKQVAQRLNFSSAVYFSQFFRHATGMTPGEFRRNGWV